MFEIHGSVPMSPLIVASDCRPMASAIKASRTVDSVGDKSSPVRLELNGIGSSSSAGRAGDEDAAAPVEKCELLTSGYSSLLAGTVNANRYCCRSALSINKVVPLGARVRSASAPTNCVHSAGREIEVDVFHR